MNILVITPTYPPFQGSHTQRMVYLTNALADDGMNVSVLTTEIMEGNPTYDPKMLDMVDERIKIYRAPFGLLHRKAYTSLKEYTDNKYGKELATKNEFKSKITAVLNKIADAILIPDTLVDWYFPAVKYVKDNNLLDTIKPDCIISCSMPNTVHVITKKLTKNYKVPVIMDYADPWVYLSYYGHSKIRFFFEKILERRCISCGSLFSFSAPGAEKLYIDKFGISQDNAFTVLTGYDGNLKTGSGSASPVSKNQSIVLTYGGALQIGIRNPSPFFESVKSFTDENILVNIRTDNIPLIEQLLNPREEYSNINISGYIPFEEYYEEMLSSDALIFWGNTTSDQLPGKIFNYLPTKKIIFYIANNYNQDEDQALSVLKEYGNYIYVRNEIDDIKRGLVQLTDLLREGKNVCDVNEANIEKYATSLQFKIFGEKIRSLSAKGKP